MGKIAVTMPGNTGDMLYALPATRMLCRMHESQCDFYTAHTSLHTKSLMEYQSCIDSLVIPENYVIQRRDIGTQPWEMPVDANAYDAVYHLGYRNVPDKMLHQYIAEQVGITVPLAIEYDFPELSTLQYDLPDDYICIGPRFKNSTYTYTLVDVANQYKSVIIGGKGEYFDVGIDMTGIDMLYTLSILSKARAFVGLMSSQLVLANGFDIPRIALHDGKSWDMRHVIQYHRNHYPINPTASQIIDIIHKG